MRAAAPVLVVVAALVALWYAAAVALNAPLARDQAARAGAALGSWQLVAATMAQARPRLPAPHQVARELWRTTVEEELHGRQGIVRSGTLSRRGLVYHGLVTLEATLVGFALGIVLGVGLAVAILTSRAMELSVMPWAIISQTVPIVALAPMIVVLTAQLGIEGRLVPKAIISAYLSFFPVLVSMLAGLRSPDAMQIDLLRTYGASSAQMLWKLRLPASLPFLFAALKVAVAAALVGAVVGELPTGAVEGLGARMLVGSQFGEPMIMWAALFAAAILAAALIVAVGLLERLARAVTGAAP